jgi:diadenosine tetraphosphate (Ap4A) HIT family hydrolase
MAELHPQLEKDCLMIGHFPLCRLLLMLDVNYPWFVLVPDREGITEIHQLTEEDQQQLMRESSYLAKVLEQEFQADKINIAALGNMVPQLHIHHVARYRNDAAWPHPVWGRVETKPYCEEAIANMIRRFQRIPLADFTFGA